MNMNHWLGMLDSDHKEGFYFEISGSAAGALAADIRSLLARTEWQPIETAPRDGTIILVAIEHYDGPLLHDIVWWNDHYDYWESAGYDWKPVKYDQVEHIFHWMPLPEPPKQEAK